MSLFNSTSSPLALRDFLGALTAIKYAYTLNVNYLAIFVSQDSQSKLANAFPFKEKQSPSNT